MHNHQPPGKYEPLKILSPSYVRQLASEGLTQTANSVAIGYMASLIDEQPTREAREAASDSFNQRYGVNIAPL